MNKHFSLMKTLVVVTVAFGMSAALNRSHAAENLIENWIAAKQHQLSSALAAKAPTVITSVGSQILPVLIDALPRVKAAAGGLAPSTLQ